MSLVVIGTVTMLTLFAGVWLICVRIANYGFLDVTWTLGIGLLGEAVADWQAAAFKRRPGSAGRILDVGLWRYSRHPNYFFETVVWVGFALGSLPLPHGWAALACPMLILYFLLRVTGIPLTEQHSVQEHGDSYRDYQRTTSAFVPWLKRRPARL